MKKLDPREYFLSRHHLEATRIDQPDVANRYAALHDELDQVDRQRVAIQMEIADLITENRCRRYRPAKAAVKPVTPTIERTIQPGDNSMKRSIADLINQMKSK